MCMLFVKYSGSRKRKRPFQGLGAPLSHLTKSMFVDVLNDFSE